MVVEPHHARAQLARDALRLIAVLRPDRGSQAVVAVIAQTRFAFEQGCRLRLRVVRPEGISGSEPLPPPVVAAAIPKGKGK